MRQLEGMFAEEGMRTVVVRTVEWFVCLSFITWWLTRIHITNQIHQQADTPETNMPARCFLEGLGYGSPVSHVRDFAINQC